MAMTTATTAQRQTAVTERTGRTVQHLETAAPRLLVARHRQASGLAQAPPAIAGTPSRKTAGRQATRA